MERKRRVRAIWGLAGAALAVAAIVVPLLVLAGSGQATLTAETYADVIRFGVRGAGTVQIQIYDLSEKELWNSGTISSDFVDWDRTDTWGERLANGYYMYLAQAWDMSGDLTLSKTGKVALLPGDQVQLQAAPAVQNPGATSGTFPIPESPLQTMGLGDIGVFKQVGIGTASPSAKLHIYASWPEIKLQDPGTGSPQMSFLSGGSLGGFFLYSQTANSFRFGNYKAGGDVRLLTGGNNERMTITGTGNVGIGTASPGQKLSVAGVIESTSGGFKFPDGTTQTTAASSGVSGWSLTGDSGTDAATNFLGTSDNVAFAVRTNSAERMRILATGNVGIGTATPGQKLSVAGVIESTTGGVKFPDGTTQTTAANGGSGWALSGNSGTNPTTDFLGTTDNVAFEVRVNNLRALRIEPGSETDPLRSPNLIAGGSDNAVAEGVFGATISGGGELGNWANRVTYGGFCTVAGGIRNTASGGNATVSGGQQNTAGSSGTNFDTVAGGVSNTASGGNSTVSGGYNNTASEINATVGGGHGNDAHEGATVSGGCSNDASGMYATVGGGDGNHATGWYAVVGGGSQNVAHGRYAAVVGGSNNMAAGEYSFVAGFWAMNEDTAHDGVFLFADSSIIAPFRSINANEFAVRASGGYRLYSNSALTAGVTMAAGASAWSTVSDRQLKENFSQLDGRDVLQRLSLIPVTEWNYKAQAPEIRHIGPMAQDFHAAFGLGESDRLISTVDVDGIALVAIQALYDLSLEKDAQIAQLTGESARQAAENAQLAEEIEDLWAQLAALKRFVQEGE